jgi:hypothetical protein
MRKELADGTPNNYYSAARLFCEMNDIIAINWKRISRGLPRMKLAAKIELPLSKKYVSWLSILTVG